MKFNSGLAEITGLILGDGCLSTYKSGGRQIFEIQLTGNSKELKYYESYVRPLFKKNFYVNGYLRLRIDDNTVRYSIKSKRIFNFFNGLGIPIGKKGKLKVPEIIKKNKKFWIPFVRGIFDAEGSIYKRYSKRYKNHPKHYKEFLVMQIKMMCTLKFMVFIKDVLKYLGIKTNNIIKTENCYVLRVTSQRDLTRFLNTIIPKVKIGLVAQPGRAAVFSRNS